MSFFKKLFGRKKDNAETNLSIHPPNLPTGDTDSAGITFLKLLDQFAGISFEQQVNLDEVIGENDWKTDLNKGTISFGTDLVFPVQVLGTFSHSSETWLWAWANPASEFPENILHQAKALRSYGMENNIPLFTTPQFDLTLDDLNTIGTVSVGLLDASAYIIADYGAGSVLQTVQSNELDQMLNNNDHRVMLLFPQMISRTEVNHRPAFVNYVHRKGFTISAEGTKLLATKTGTTITAEFDEQSRLTSLHASFTD